MLLLAPDVHELTAAVQDMPGSIEIQPPDDEDNHANESGKEENLPLSR